MKGTLLKRSIIATLIFVFFFGNYPYSAKDSYAGGGTVSGVSVNYDLGSVEMHPAWTEEEVRLAYLSNLNIDEQNGVQLDKANSTLMYLDDNGQFVGIGDGSDQITSEREYYFAAAIIISDDFELPDKVKNTKKATKISDGLSDDFKVRINGASIPQLTYLYTNNKATKLWIYFKAPGVSTEKKIVSVTVDEDFKKIIPGNQKKYTATVRGYAPDMSVKWTLIGAEKGSTISDSGLLYVHKEETADSLTIVATSNYDNTKKYAFGVYINHDEVVDKVSVNASLGNVCLNPIFTQGEITKQIKSNIVNDTKGCTIVQEYTGLVSRQEGKAVYVIGENDENHVDTSKEYLIRVALSMEAGYTWPACLEDLNPNALYKAGTFISSMSFLFNNSSSKDYLVNYNQSKNLLILYVPVSIEKVNLKKLGNDLTISGVEDKVYIGREVTQSVKVTVGGYRLKEDVDFVISYEDNKNIGEAVIFINGIGCFEGTVSRTFKIKSEDSEQGNGSDKNGASQSRSNEWADGKWYDENGKQTYKATLQWKQDAYGWWVEDTNGWYPVSSWQKIDGKWYYFCSDGYMDYSEYRDGCWLGSDGAWVEAYSGGRWGYNEIGWWYQDSTGWYPCSQWLWIDGSCYWFNANGYME